jgi:hypothetical protein
MENDEILKNLINHAVLEKPLDFQSVFNSALTDRINDSINNKKIEIAQSIFNSEEDIPDESSEEDQPSEEEVQNDTEELEGNGEES